MKKLWELLVQREQAGDFGIEIEVEGLRLPILEGDKYWRSEADGSLRNGGTEYVLKKPLGLKYIAPVLRHLQHRFDDVEAEPEFSFRTSVHVHMNVQKLEMSHIFNTIYTYLLLEDVLMNFCGEGRKANRFCLRARDAEYLMEILSNLFRHGEEGLRYIPNNMARYSAINIEAMLKYGSLEFRAMQGNMDVERIVTWCKGLENIRTFACKFATPAEVYNHYIKLEAQAFFNEVMGEVAPAFECPDLVKNIQQGFSLSIDLPFAFVAKKGDAPQPKIAVPKYKALAPRMNWEALARVPAPDHMVAWQAAVPEQAVGNPRIEAAVRRGADELEARIINNIEQLDPEEI